MYKIFHPLVETVHLEYLAFFFFFCINFSSFNFHPSLFPRLTSVFEIEIVTSYAHNQKNYLVRFSAVPFDSPKPLYNHFLSSLSFAFIENIQLSKGFAKANFYDKCYQTNVACVAFAARTKERNVRGRFSLFCIFLCEFISRGSLLRNLSSQ